MADRTDVAAPTLTSPLGAADELLRAVPRLVERTVHQAELARSLAGHLPCLGALLAPRRRDESPGRAAPEPVSVQDLFDDTSSPAGTEPVAEPVARAAAPEPATARDAATAPEAATATATAVPTEADLPVADYDSLAASQVVPRLAMLDPEDLRAVQAYESAHRHRQTILNRVAQLLEA